jgi:thioester reductase-like protein
VIGLVHSGTLANERAEAVRADVTAERLGLPEREYRELAARADVIVHSAGLVDFGLPEERYQRINVVGSQRLIEFALAAEAPVHHVSTAFVQAFAHDAPVELKPPNAVYAYVASKIESDRLFAESGLPYTVYRPPNLVGDSRTGAISRKQFATQIASDVLRGRFPFLPARPGVRLDMVPQDVCGRAIAAAVAADDIGSEYWLTYGPDAMSVRELIDLCVGFAESIGHPVDPPRLVDPDRPEEAEEELVKLPSAARVFYQRLVELSDAMSAGGQFPTSLPLLEERYGLPIPDLRDAVRRGLEYVARSKGLGEPALS